MRRSDSARLGRRVVEASFDGGDIVSDGSVLLLRQVDRRIGLTRAAATALGDQQRGASVAQSVQAMVAQRVYGLCCEWEDVTGHNWLPQRPGDADGGRPASASWLNQVERWFATLTEKYIRRGTHRSTRQLEQAIRHYIKINNDDPKPFVWSKEWPTTV